MDGIPSSLYKADEAKHMELPEEDLNVTANQNHSRIWNGIIGTDKERLNRIEFYNQLFPEEPLKKTATFVEVERAFRFLSLEENAEFLERIEGGYKASKKAFGVLGFKPKSRQDIEFAIAKKIGTKMLKLKIDEVTPKDEMFFNKSVKDIEEMEGLCLVPNINSTTRALFYEGVVLDNDGKLHFVIDPSRVDTNISPTGEEIQGFLFPAPDLSNASFKPLFLLYGEVLSELGNRNITPTRFVTITDFDSPGLNTCANILKSFIEYIKAMPKGRLE